eukprot:TRINITY_DN37951_c0_g1_i1.p1 TRINITY_DN37951_c0_g1~~TRINITY_DN37951_c0_g1_i1.p1  ORF type:complete len:358 (+),score=42.70 TRINITY_DN37951_c0_g1_i1:86-1075(+)
MAPVSMPVVCQNGFAKGGKKPERIVSYDIAWAWAKVLADSAASTASRKSASPDLHVFFGARAPDLDMCGYFSRFWGHFKCSRECYIVASVYIDRIVTRRPDLWMNDLSIHRLLLTSMVLAAKFHDDLQFRNSVYAQIGGVSTSELASLERAFCSLIDWNLYVSRVEYERYFELLKRKARKARDTGGEFGSEGPDCLQKRVASVPASMSTYCMSLCRAPPAAPAHEPLTKSATVALVHPCHVQSAAVVAVATDLEEATETSATLLIKMDDKELGGALVVAQETKEYSSAVQKVRKTYPLAVMQDGQPHVRRFQPRNRGTAQRPRSCWRQC